MTSSSARRRRRGLLALLLLVASSGAAAAPAPADSTAPPRGRVQYPDGTSGELVPAALPFGTGEVLDFEIQYGIVSVGRARLETRAVERHRGRPTLELVSRAKSAQWIDAVYKVRDEIRSLFDLEALCSLRFRKQLREGDYKADFDAEYLHAESVARYADGSESPLVPGSQDILSALFYVRAFALQEGMVLHIPVHDAKKSYPLRVAVTGRERVETRLGGYDCLVLEPTLQSQGLFKSEGRMLIYLSDDARRLPVKLKARAPVGAFTSELVAYREGKPLPPPAGDAQSMGSSE